MTQNNRITRDYGTNGPPVPDVGFADFSPTEMYNLSESVAENISVINVGWKYLNTQMKVIGTKKDNQEMRDKIYEMQKNVTTSVNSTTKDIQRLKVILRWGDKRQKLHLEKMVQLFQEALEKYSNTQKQLVKKMQKHMPVKQMTDFAQERGNAEEDDDTARLVAQKQAQSRKLEFETSMLEEREAYCRQIEANVLDVHQIMTELGAIVYTQGATIDTIESNIEAGAANVEEGTEQLVKAAHYQSRFRRKMLILLVIAVAIGIILTIILVNTLKR